MKLWQLLIGIILASQTAMAGPKTATDADFDDDQDKLTVARKAFKANNFDLAISQYKKISKTSPRWTLAKEELGWSYFRKKDYAMAMAEVRSLTNDFMFAEVDLEPYLLQSLILLVNCDYRGVFNVLKELKRQMGEYVSSMESLSDGKFTPGQVKILNQILKDKTYRNLDPKKTTLLPRKFYLDQKTADAIRTGNVELLKSRLISLARKDNGRNQKKLQYLQLVEVEAVQRAFIPSKFKGMAKMAIQRTGKDDLMIFNNDAEMWGDEVDKTQADIQLCESKTGRSL